MKDITEFLKECRVNGNEKIDTNDDSFWRLKDLLEHYKEQCIIGGVVGSLPTEEQIEDKVIRVGCSTWGDYGAGYVDGTRNGATWVIDVVNGEDK